MIAGPASGPDPPGARILVVDDSAAVRDMLQIGLSKAGFAVRAIADGRDVIDVLQSWNPETVLLDIVLPEMDGHAVLAAVRRISDVPVIVISGRTALSEKVASLRNGADDYLTKPFAIEELVARLFTALRRPRLEGRTTLSYADLHLDTSRRSATRASRSLQLSRREFDLLLTFLQQPERVFTRLELLDLIWGSERDVTPNVVESFISVLRSKVDAGASVRLIRTVRGVGYSLTAHDEGS